MRRERPLPKRRQRRLPEPPMNRSVPQQQEHLRSSGYLGAKEELVQVHGLSPDVVERAMDEATRTPGVPIEVATQNGYTTRVTANKDVVDSYTIQTRGS